MNKYKNYTDTEYPFIKMKDGELYFIPELDTERVELKPEIDLLKKHLNINRVFENTNDGTEHTWNFGIANEKK